LAAGDRLMTSDTVADDNPRCAASSFKLIWLGAPCTVGEEECIFRLDMSYICG